MRENIQFSWVGPTQVIFSGLNLCFLFYPWGIDGHLHGPEFVFVRNRTYRGGGRLFMFLPFGVPKKSGSVQEILFGLIFVKLIRWVIHFTVWLVESWGFVVL